MCIRDRNPIQHSKTKHIEIRHHFIKDHVINGDCVIQFVNSKNQLADLFTKPLNNERFNFLINELGIIDFKNIWKLNQLINVLIFGYFLLLIKSIKTIYWALTEFIGIDINSDFV